MKTSKRNPTCMADGGVLLRQMGVRQFADGVTPVSPYSVYGIGRTISNAYGAARSGMADAMETIHNRTSSPLGYVPAAQQTPAAAPAIAPAVPPPQGLVPRLMGVVDQRDVMARREAAAGLRNGSPFVSGSGGPIDDKVPARLSVGESVLPADTTAAVGPSNVQALIDATHTPASAQPQGLRHYAAGVADVEDPRYPAGQQGPSVATAVPAALPAFTPSASIAPVSRAPVTPGLPRPSPFNTAFPTDPAALGAPALKPGAPSDAAPFGFGLPSMKDSLAGSVNTRMAVRGAFDDTRTAVNAGQYPEAAGNVLRGIALTPAMIAKDAFNNIGDRLAWAPRFINAAMGRDPAVPGAAAATGVRAAGALPAGVAPSGGRDTVQLAQPQIGTAGGAPAPSGGQGSDDGAYDPATIRRIDGGSSPLFTNMPDSGMGGNDSLMARKSSPQNEGALRSLFARTNKEAADAQRGYAYDKQVADAAAGNAWGRQNAARVTADMKAEGDASAGAFNRDRSTAGMNNSQRASMIIAEKANAERMAETQMTTDTQRAMNEREAGVNLRGQGLVHEASMYGTQMQGLSNRARLGFDFNNIMREQRNNERDAALKRDEYVQTVGTNERATATAGQDAWDKSLATRYTTTNSKTGAQEVDKAAVAEHQVMADTYIAKQIAKARAAGRGDLAGRLEKLKYASLGQKENEMISQAVRAKKLIADNRGFGPLAGRNVESNDPEEYMITGTHTNAGGIGSEVYKFKNGAELPRRVMDLAGGGNKYAPNWMYGNGSPSRTYGELGQNRFTQ